MATKYFGNDGVFYEVSLTNVPGDRPIVIWLFPVVRGSMASVYPSNSDDYRRARISLKNKKIKHKKKTRIYEKKTRILFNHINCEKTWRPLICRLNAPYEYTVRWPVAPLQKS